MIRSKRKDVESLEIPSAFRDLPQKADTAFYPELTAQLLQAVFQTAATHDGEETHRREALQGCRKRPNQGGLILVWVEATDIADDPSILRKTQHITCLSARQQP